ncbi:hypothetical protein VHEMI09895 [[Torrubiella] hemipterigena]|uniref:Uncharacterized protein n=1 Tax=[Torrubiella] hemipterigena TaxID=1531966 RepID=A0A0A1TR57_9HYPO|nr:hypothetical protein VHEMI09895 [[Torrubiella] hemipterigena]
MHEEYSLQPRISVVGAGHVGCALAFDLAERGYDVTIRTLPGHDGYSSQVSANGGMLTANGALSGCVHVGVGDGFSELSERYMFITVPSQGHDAVLMELSTIDLLHCTIIFINGNGIGLKASKYLNARRIMDTATSPYSSRVNADGTISIRGIKAKVQLAALPLVTERRERDEIDSLFRMPLTWSSNLLEIFFTGLNGVIHAPAALMNFGWIESTKGDFYFYKQGMSPGVCSIIEAADRERLAVAAAYGCPVDSALTTFNRNYCTNAASLHEFASITVAHNKTKGVQTRFLDQDVPYWLVFCSELGRQASVPTPFLDLIILLASTIRGVPFRIVGRTLKSMGLQGLSHESIYNVFQGTVLV